VDVGGAFFDGGGEDFIDNYREGLTDPSSINEEQVEYIREH